MIRISIQISRYNELKELFKEILKDNHEIKIDQLDINKVYDIFIIEINHIDDLSIIDDLRRHSESLIYVIGNKDFEIVNECIRKNVHLYMIKDDLYSEVNKYKEDIFNHIQQRFQYYTYKRNGMNSHIRLSQIFYIESLRHNIIIHSINGEFVERKSLGDFLKEVSSSHFIQIHKSFVVNKQQIDKITSKDVIVKNGAILPIGRVYKTVLKV